MLGLGLNSITEHGELSNNVVTRTIDKSEQGQIGLGYIRLEDINTPISKLPQNYNFQLDQIDDALEIYLVLGNNTKNHIEALISTLLNYKQTEVKLDNRSGILHLINLSPEQDTLIPLEINIEKEGLHDLQVLAFEDPFNLSLDLSYRTDMRGYAFSRRTSVTKGNTSEPVRSMHIMYEGQKPFSERRVKFPVMFQRHSVKETMPNSTSQELIYTDTLKLNEVYPLRIIIPSRVRSEVGTRSCVFFLNYHQIQVSSQDVITTELELGEETIIDTNITLLAEPGVHQLQAFCLTDPYTDLLGVDTPGARSIIASPRIAIVVK